MATKVRERLGRIDGITERCGYFEPHVAEQIFEDFIRETKI